MPLAPRSFSTMRRDAQTGISRKRLWLAPVGVWGIRGGWELEVYLLVVLGKSEGVKGYGGGKRERGQRERKE